MFICVEVVCEGCHAFVTGKCGRLIFILFYKYEQRIERPKGLIWLSEQANQLVHCSSELKQKQAIENLSFLQRLIIRSLFLILIDSNLITTKSHLAKQ